MAPVKKKNEMKSLFIELSDSLDTITENPEKFLLPQPDLCPKIRDFVKKTYSAAVKCDIGNKNSLEILPELIVDEDMDEEQIWQQLELRNNIVIDQLVKQTAELLSLNEEQFEIHLDESGAESELDSEEEEFYEEDDVIDGGEELDEKNGVPDEEDDADDEDEFEEKALRGKEKQKKGKGRKSIVDDKFFKLSEMEEFLEQEDNKELRKQKGKPLANEDDIDYFADDFHDGDDSDDDNPNYKDFFDEVDGEDDAKNEEGTKSKKKTKKPENDFFVNNDDDAENEVGTKSKKKTKKPEKDFFANNDEDAEKEVGTTSKKKTKKSERDFFANNDEDADEARKEVETKSKKKIKKSEKDFFENKDNDEEKDGDEEEAEESDADDDESDESEIDNNEDLDEDVSKTNRLQPASDSDSNDDDDDDNDDEEEKELTEEQKSNFELRERRLQQRMREYEAEVLGEKPWQLRGEVVAPNRPQNSLLEEILEFDANIRPAPIITEETTRCLEDIIRQRIKDQAWDDPVRTVRPSLTPQEYRKQLILDQEKPKESLAQVYEKEYQREVDKHSANRDDDTNEPELKAHQEIRNAMQMLFRKLDALSNFHFIPKPIAPEPKIVTNTPAINMEEVAPVALSDAALLAPEEIFRGPKHELIGKAERTRTDKNRERRKKKQKQRAINSALEKRDINRQKQGKPISKKSEDAKLLKSITKQRNVQKITASNDQGSLKSSKAFFSKLQATASSTGTAGNKRAKKQQSTDPSKNNAKKFKL